ncbi:MAG: hypothetical protein WCV90_00325 [Candidatus Woesearchaeota archaeon]|jgi:hypothetical protein
MVDTTYTFRGHLTPWSIGHFVVTEVPTAEGLQQILDLSPSSSSYNPDPSVLAGPLRQGKHVCYYGTFFSQGGSRGADLELRVAPPVNGYTGLKMLGDILGHKNAIVESNPGIGTVRFSYISKDMIRGEIPFPRVADPIRVKKWSRY